MSSKTVTLHGGPLHGKTMAVPLDWDHFHIAGMPNLADLYSTMNDETSPLESVTRQGTYSRVAGSSTDFEWDGWVSH
ncbi:hypothetical protein SEA_CHEETO1_49 [Microbacterium phage Cheeto1]|nr:hypothetical protein SEA_CHEETO1_49 [Microbacterium phage Cheeto1]